MNIELIDGRNYKVNKGDCAICWHFKYDGNRIIGKADEGYVNLKYGDVITYLGIKDTKVSSKSNAPIATFSFDNNEGAFFHMDVYGNIKEGYLELIKND